MLEFTIDYEAVAALEPDLADGDPIVSNDAAAYARDWCICLGAVMRLASGRSDRPFDRKAAFVAEAGAKGVEVLAREPATIRSGSSSARWSAAGDEHVLVLDELLDPPAAALAAEPALLVAAERSAR